MDFRRLEDCRSFAAGTELDYRKDKRRDLIALDVDSRQEDWSRPVCTADLMPGLGPTCSCTVADWVKRHKLRMYPGYDGIAGGLHCVHWDRRQRRDSSDSGGLVVNRYVNRIAQTDVVHRCHAHHSRADH